MRSKLSNSRIRLCFTRAHVAGSSTGGTTCARTYCGPSTVDLLNPRSVAAVAKEESVVFGEMERKYNHLDTRVSIIFLSHASAVHGCCRRILDVVEGLGAARNCGRLHTGSLSNPKTLAWINFVANVALCLYIVWVDKHICTTYVLRRQVDTNTHQLC